MKRRSFLWQGACCAVLSSDRRLARAAAPSQSKAFRLVAGVDHDRILRLAGEAVTEKPLTVTGVISPKSPGGPHDYFSQADYFWPDPKNPGGPYMNRDGQSNPENFDGHRRAMVEMSRWVPLLTAAWLLTGERRYGQAACDHLRAWFVTPATRMNPNLQYSQGVVGVSTGRNYGIIDTLHLAEVARAASFLAPGLMTGPDRQALMAWFREYLGWLNTSDMGHKERDTKNNHATCWALQAAEFSRLIGDGAMRRQVADWYRAHLLTNQMGPDGSFPLELARTKPYSYSIFNFDIAASLAQSLGPATLHETLPDGRGLCKAAAWLYPFLKDKTAWPYPHDVQHFDALPARSPGLLFAGLSCAQPAYVELWKQENPDPTDREIIRNYPVRQPLLWV